MIYKEGSGPLIVFLHGWGSNKEVFQAFYRDLKKDFTVLGIDLPGFGNHPLNKVYHIEDYLHHLENFLKHEKVLALVGHSFGARLACDLVHRIHCEKLILIASSGFREVSLKVQGKIFLYKFLGKILRPFFPKALEKIKKFFGSSDYLQANPLMKKVIVNVLNEGLKEEDLRKIIQPTLLIWGNKDQSAPFKFHEKFLKNIPNSGLVTIQDAGHYPFLDDYFTVFKALEYFLKKC